MHDARACLHPESFEFLSVHSMLRSVSFTTREPLKLETPWTRLFHQKAWASTLKHRGVIRPAPCVLSILMKLFFVISNCASTLHRLGERILRGFSTPFRRSTTLRDVLSSLRRVPLIRAPKPFPRGILVCFSLLSSGQPQSSRHCIPPPQQFTQYDASSW